MSVKFPSLDGETSVALGGQLMWRWIKRCLVVKYRGYKSMVHWCKQMGCSDFLHPRARLHVVVMIKYHQQTHACIPSCSQASMRALRASTPASRACTPASRAYTPALRASTLAYRGAAASVQSCHACVWLRVAPATTPASGPVMLGS